MTDDIKLAQKGDTAAFARLYETVYKELYHTAYYALRNNEHDAADVVSDTVIDAYASIGKLKNINSFKSWIFSILSKKIKQKQRRYYDYLEDIETVGLSENFAYDSSELKNVLDLMPEKDRLILSLSVLCGYTGEEIGKICDLKPSTVRSRLSRIKAVLRMQLQD
ncbi:MAG: RNA polymerase sigma factor [Ruminococcus sp.]|nr:RNA polymerase sigma factor [Ruminococcus sp.]